MTKKQLKLRGFKPGSAKGRETQHLSDSIKEIEKSGSAGYLTYRGRRYLVTTNMDDFLESESRECFVKERNRIALRVLTDKDGLKYCSGAKRYLQWSDIMAYVIKSWKKVGAE